MGILANLMPGVRAVRAPLAAGFLLLLCAWIAFESDIPEEPTDGVWASLERLEPIASAVGTLGLISFVAYVIGSLYLVVITNFGPRQRQAGSVDALLTPASRLDLRFNAHRLYRAQQRLPRWFSGVAIPLTPDAAVRLLSYVEANLDVLASGADRDFAARIPHSDEYPNERTLVALATIQRIFHEQWETLPLTIVGTQPHLYGEIDRFQSEAEFRTALQGPLMLLAVVLGYTGAPWGLTLGLAVAGLVGGVLGYAIADSQRRANTVLANGIAAKLVDVQGPLPESPRSPPPHSPHEAS